MALIRNIAGLGAIQDFETLKCADPGCTNTGDGGSFQTNDIGPYVYKQVEGSGVFPPVTDFPVETIEPVNKPVAVTVQTPNVVAIAPATPDPSGNNKTDTLGLLILGAMGLILAQKDTKGFVYPGLYLGGVAALYYHLKK